MEAEASYLERHQFDSRCCSFYHRNSYSSSSISKGINNSFPDFERIPSPVSFSDWRLNWPMLQSKEGQISNAEDQNHGTGVASARIISLPLTLGTHNCGR